MNVISIRAGMTSQEKATAIAAFNDPQSKVNVLLMNTLVGSAGLNLHHSCSFGIQVQMPWSFGCTGQYIGRLVRLKQTKSVKWVILTVNDTAYDWMEYKSCMKEVRALNATLCFRPWMEEWRIVREILCWEVLRVMWSQPFNRYTWKVNHPSFIEDFTSAATRHAGKFYSELADLFLYTDEPPPDVGELLKDLKDLISALPGKWKGEAIETWDVLRDLIKTTKGDEDHLAAVTARQATHEFGTERKRRVVDLLESDKVPSRKRKAEDSPSSRAKKPKSSERVSAEDLNDDSSDGSGDGGEDGSGEDGSDDVDIVLE